LQGSSGRQGGFWIRSTPLVYLEQRDSRGIGTNRSDPRVVRAGILGLVGFLLPAQTIEGNSRPEGDDQASYFSVIHGSGNTAKSNLFGTLRRRKLDKRFANFPRDPTCASAIQTEPGYQTGPQTENSPGMLAQNHWTSEGGSQIKLKGRWCKAHSQDRRRHGFAFNCLPPLPGGSGGLPVGRLVIQDRPTDIQVGL